MPVPSTKGIPGRIVIQYPTPAIDGGRYPAKRVVGDTVAVTADIFADGHDVLRAVVRYRAPGARRWLEAPLRPLDAQVNGVRWGGEFPVETIGRWQCTIEAWSDVFATWRDELQRKLGAGQEDLAGELSEGVVLLEQAAGRAKAAADRKLIGQALEALRDPTAPPDAALAPDLFAAMERVSGAHRRSLAGGAAGARGRPRARRLRLLVRAVPALVGRPARASRPRSPRSPSSASTSSTCRPSTRSASRTARAPTTRSPPAPTTPARPTRSARRRAATTRCTRSSARWRTCAPCVPRRASTAWTSRSTSRSTPRPTTRGSKSTRSGSSSAPTARSSTPRTRPSATRTSTTSTGTRPPGASCGRPGGTSSCTGSTPASRSSASTTRTRSRSRSGSG